VLLERAQLTSGTSWHATGLLTSLRDTETQTKLPKYSQDLYRTLEAETGHATGIIDCGSIELAMTSDKAEEMRRGMHMAHCFGGRNNRNIAGPSQGHVAARRCERFESRVLFSE
jgi:4-methylaminobutanoate oxidase (formaldehyde-forming)